MRKEFSYALPGLFIVLADRKSEAFWENVFEKIFCYLNLNYTALSVVTEKKDKNIIKRAFKLMDVDAVFLTGGFKKNWSEEDVYTHLLIAEEGELRPCNIAEESASDFFSSIDNIINDADIIISGSDDKYKIFQDIIRRVSRTNIRHFKTIDDIDQISEREILIIVDDHEPIEKEKIQKFNHIIDFRDSKITDKQLRRLKNLVPNNSYLSNIIQLTIKKLTGHCPGKDIVEDILDGGKQA